MPRSLGVRLPAGLAAGLLTLALPLVSAPAARAQEAAPASLTLVHGVRGLVADVRLDDTLVLSGFAPERVTDPLTVPAGPHRVQAWPSGAPAGSTPVVDQVITLAAGAQLTAGIGLGADGKPVITLFDDAALLKDPAGTALGVRGLAAADPVKVSAGDVVVAPSLSTTQGAVQQVAPGTYPVTVVPVSGTGSVVPPQDVPLAVGRATVLYLIGSQRDATLGWVAQTVRPSAAAAPVRVDTGVGPLPSAGDPVTVMLVLGLPTGLLAAVALRSRRRVLSAAG